MKTESIYELTAIVRGSLKETESEKASGEIAKLLTKLKAEVVKSEALGRENLAYPIAGEAQGYYYYWELKFPGSRVRQLELELSRMGAVIRHLVIKQDS